MNKCKTIKERQTTKQKNIAGSNSKRQNFTNKTAIAAEAITFCIQPLTHYLSSSALKTDETWTTVITTKMKQNFILLKTFGNVKKSKIIKLVENLIVWKSWQGYQ